MGRLRSGIAAGLRAIATWRFFKPAAFLACLWPGAALGYRTWLLFSGRDPDALGADPAKQLLHETGETALAILFVTLSLTPLRRIFGVPRLQAVRRLVGVWSFVYALVHLSLYLVLDQLCYSPATCDLDGIVADLKERRFIFVGMLAFGLLLVLAVTSTNGWMRRLKRNWTRLHRLVYVAATAGVVHFIWIQKSDLSLPLTWAAVLAGLLGIRVFFWSTRSRAVPGGQPARP
jgi:sulfoxide reductase heme-binding subunit YedZ